MKHLLLAILLIVFISGCCTRQRTATEQEAWDKWHSKHLEYLQEREIWEKRYLSE